MRRHLRAEQGELVERKGRFGSFYSCERYPECDFSVNQMPMPTPCPSCGVLVVAARGNATRCIQCGKAWASDGTELPEEEAKALVPRSRGARGSSGSKAKSGARSKSTARKRSTPSVSTSAGRKRSTA